MGNRILEDPSIDAWFQITRGDGTFQQTLCSGKDLNAHHPWIGDLACRANSTFNSSESVSHLSHEACWNILTADGREPDPTLHTARKRLRKKLAHLSAASERERAAESGT